VEEIYRREKREAVAKGERSWRKKDIRVEGSVTMEGNCHGRRKDIIVERDHIER
jgi:hypothetical protein